MHDIITHGRGMWILRITDGRGIWYNLMPKLIKKQIAVFRKFRL